MSMVSWEMKVCMQAAGLSEGYPGKSGSVLGGVFDNQRAWTGTLSGWRIKLLCSCAAPASCVLSPASHQDMYKTQVMLLRCKEETVYSFARALRPGEKLQRCDCQSACRKLLLLSSVSSDDDGQIGLVNGCTFPRGKWESARLNFLKRDCVP